MSRKTIELVEILETCNKQLRSGEWSDEQKKMICLVLEDLLHKADVYAGFNDNYWLAIGCTEWHENGEPNFPEKEKYIYGPSNQRYNRFYYTHKSLRTESK